MGRRLKLWGFVIVCITLLAQQAIKRPRPTPLPYLPRNAKDVMKKCKREGESDCYQCKNGIICCIDMNTMLMLCNMGQ
jgi:hypothetical protein